MAILPLNSHIWVSASAGTGKTTILTNRVLQLLLSGAKPSTILCLTYTNAAAAEMKQRIMERLGSWVIAEQGELQKQLASITTHTSDNVLKRARALFFEVSENPDSLNIQTIHSFCQSILKRFPVEANISPYFSVIDEERSQEIIEQSFEGLLREVQQGKHPDIAMHIDQIVTEMNDNAFRNFIKNAIGDNSRWREWMGQPGGIASCEAKLAEFLDVSSHVSTAPMVLDDLRKHQLFTLYQFLSTLKAKPLQQLASEIHALLGLLEISQQDMQEYSAGWLTQKHEPRAPITKLLEAGGEHAALIAAELERVQAYRYQQAHQASLSITNHLTHILHAVFERYEASCHTQGYLDYHHLLHKTQLFLKQDEHALGWVMFKLDGGIDHVLVDEAQDTNPLQWQIIQAITAEYFTGQGRKETNRTLFIVGDDKQSIFGFQDADLDYYLSIKDWLMDRASAAGQAFHEEKLLTSFRSTPAVIDAVNRVTGALELGAPHVADRKDNGVVEVWPLVEAPDGENESTTAPEQLAYQIADKVASWITAGRTLDSKARPIGPSDIMILVRKRSALSVTLASELRHRNIPVQGVERLALKDNLAVQDILSLMQWCLLEQDDYSLACVLRSPICGISEEQLFALAHEREEQSLWQQLQTKAEPLQLDKALKLLQAAKLRIQTHSIHAFIYHLLYEDELANRCIQRLGQEVMIPLKALMEKAKQFEAAHPHNYQYFIEHIQSQQHEITSKEATPNCVRIMTIHGSKGLEAPIVIMADSNSTTSAISGFEWLDYDGHKLPCNLPPKQDRSPALNQKIAVTERKNQAESQRLLYVAMTRARDELYITGHLQRTNNSTTWYQLLNEQLQNDE